MNRNPDCGGSHCVNSIGEVRVLPTGGSSNAILCLHCFVYEIEARKQRNRQLAEFAKFKLPDWKDLEIYKTEMEAK